MNTKFQKIEEIVLQDPGGRGFPAFHQMGNYEKAADCLLKGNAVWLTSGFWILAAGQIETDGPLGVAVLLSVLQQLGQSTTLIVDNHSREIFQATLEAMKLQTPIKTVNEMTSEKRPSGLSFISLERPGKAVDGQYYNFRGLSISSFTDDTDSLMNSLASESVPTICIGDGGNELGMGNFRTQVESHLTGDRPFAAVSSSDFPLCAGVSNWGGYALAATLALKSSTKVILPSVEELEKALEACVMKGCVDGVSGKQENTVDGLPLGFESQIYRQILEVIG